MPLTLKEEFQIGFTHDQSLKYSSWRRWIYFMFASNDCVYWGFSCAQPWAKYYRSYYFVESSELVLRACSVTQSCPTLCNPMDCSPPGSSVHGISQAKILKWVAIPSAGDLHIYIYEKLFKWVYYGKICVQHPCIHAEYTCWVQTLIKVSNQVCDTRQRLTWHNTSMYFWDNCRVCSKFGDYPPNAIKFCWTGCHCI